MKVSLLKFAAAGLAICISVGALLFPASKLVVAAQSDPTRTLVVTVTDKKDAPLNGLPSSSFSAINSNVIKDIVDSKQADSPISVAIVFDISGTMGNGRDLKASKRTQAALTALARFVKASNPENEYVVVKFNDKVHLLHDQFQDANATTADLNSMGTQTFINGAALYDALQFALDTLSPSRLKKQVIILVTDSDDDSSRTTFKELLRSFGQNTALIYSILLLPESYSDLTGSSGLVDENRSILKDFASLSGGKYFQAQRSQELNDIVDRIAIELHSQYLVTVALASNLEKKCHEFKLRLASDNKPELKSSSVRTRKVICVP